MKFVHLADMHFDSPFTFLNNKNELGEKRRLEQRNIFKKVIEYIKQNNVDYFFISGDLYEHEYIKKTTIDYINNLFKEIPNTKIFIAPGNHDPYTQNSYYKNYNWEKNVVIFTNKIEKKEEDNISVYGYGFADFYCKDSKISELQIENKENINILIIHGSLDSGGAENKEYNPISSKKLEEIGFDYVALGHIHKRTKDNDLDKRIVYPGSTISLGFDEQNAHGIIVGELTKENLKVNFLRFDNKEYIEKNLNISDIYSKEELIELINNLEEKENEFIKINLIGTRNFIIEINDLLKLIEKNNILKIKDNTKIKYNLEQISKENNLKGLFVKIMLEKLNNNQYDEKEIEKAIEIGLELLQ